MQISRDALAKVWATETRAVYRSGLTLSIERATRKGTTDWSQAEVNYENWMRDYQTPDWREREAELTRWRRPILEVQCESRVWESGDAIRSSVICW